MLQQTLEQWREEAAARFGEKTAYWKFVCPSCSGVQSPQDFIKHGLEPQDAANAAYQECIGRKVQGIGCDWAAFGLFGTLGKGREVITPEGKTVEVFDFAPVPVPEDGQEETKKEIKEDDSHGETS